MQEAIKLIYQNNDIIFVSIHSLHKLSKYKGKDSGEPPKLSKLGTGAWEKMKERTKSKVKDIARDLILLYSKRKQETGFAYSPDSFMQHELEASFIYEDTPDQMKATVDVKADMENDPSDGPTDLRRRRFRKNRGGHPCGFQGRIGQQASGRAGPDHRTSIPALSNIFRTVEGFSLPIEYISRARTARNKGTLKELKEGKVNISSAPIESSEKMYVQRSRSAYHRRGTEVRRIRQREATPAEGERRHAYHDRHPDPPYPTILVDGGP